MCFPHEQVLAIFSRHLPWQGLLWSGSKLNLQNAGLTQGASHAKAPALRTIRFGVAYTPTRSAD